MGNESQAACQAEPISSHQLPHLGPLTLLRQQEQYCFLKVFSYSDQFLMEDRFRKLKMRTTKFPNNPHVLNVHNVAKRERKDLCANNFHLLAYLEHFQHTLQSTLASRLQQRRNYSEGELFEFLSKLVDTLLYLQDNGLKNIHLDSQSILLIGQHVKVLDSGLACSKTYLNLLQHRHKHANQEGTVYLAPQLLKELEDRNYDPYISPKADVFSLGMLLLEMVTLEPMHNYYDFTRLSIDYDSLIHRLSRISHSLPLKTLIAEMLEYDPEERVGLLSLKEKLRRLTAPEQAITRSKSSKMLQELLSHSRRSSSICRQSENSISLSRQPSSEKKQQQPKIAARCSDKKELQGLRNGTSPAAALGSGREESAREERPRRGERSGREEPISRREETGRPEFEVSQQSNLRDLVKNKLCRNNKKQGSSRLLRPLRKQTTPFAEHNQLLHHKLAFQSSSCNRNSLQTSLFNRQLDSSLPQQQHSSTLIQDASKLLKLQQLDSSTSKGQSQRQSQQSQRQSQQSQHQSLKNTSRFGSTQLYPEQRPFSISRPAQLYVNQEQQAEYTVEIDEFRLPEKTLSKVMTFNREIREIEMQAKSVQSSRELAPSFQAEKSLSKLAFSPINPDSAYAESGCKNITIKDVPVVVSLEKMYEASPPPCHFGNIQRQLNSLQVSESVRQGSSCDSSFNSSKVIQSYRPLADSLLGKADSLLGKADSLLGKADSLLGKGDSLLGKGVAKAEPPGYQITAAFKKPKSKKPQLMIQLCGEETCSQPLPLALHPRKSHLQNLYKTSQSIEHLSNFTSISPPEQNKQNSFSLNYVKTSFSPDFDQDLSATLTLGSGQQYQGQTLGQLPHGNGVLYSHGKPLFSGSFKLGKFHGYGTLHNNSFESTPVDYRCIDLGTNNWLRFEGEFEQDAMNGFGTLFFPEGEKFSGCLNKGIIEGYGCFYRRNGELVSGLWSENRFRKV